MEFDNSTEQVTASGEQSGVVDSMQSPNEGQESVVDSQPENTDFDTVEVGEDEVHGGQSDAEAETEAETDTEEPDGAGRADGAKQAAHAAHSQTREENAAMRSMRLRAQRDAEMAAAAKADAMIAGMTGLKNPYTKKPFASMQELIDYNERVIKAENAKKARETGRPIEEIEEDAANRAFLSALRKETVDRAAAAQQQQASKEWFRQDLANFQSAHPEVDVSALDNNPRFRTFVGSRYGREPLAKLYDDYVALVGDASAAAVAKAASRSTRSTGSGSTGGATLSPAQKIALDKWNDEHPEMKMTAKEFLQR